MKVVTKLALAVLVMAAFPAFSATPSTSFSFAGAAPGIAVQAGMAYDAARAYGFENGTSASNAKPWLFPPRRSSWRYPPAPP
jgi:hypothetical protein